MSKHSKVSVYLALSVVLATLSACSREEAPPEPVRAVKVITVGAQGWQTDAVYAGEVRARVESRLGFRVGGKLTHRAVDAGQRVSAAQLLAAIDAPDGRAHGVLSGPMADAITARFKATSPVFIDVSTERRYAQSGCRRLKVSFWQDGVQLPGEPGPRRRTIDFGINYCRDGLPPRSLSRGA